MHMGLAEPPALYPYVADQREQSILHSVVLTGTSALAIAYMLTTVPYEKRIAPMVLGWMGMGGLWWLGLEGIAGIIHHLSKPAEKSA
jgi:hypothetical protein